MEAAEMSKDKNWTILNENPSWVLEAPKKAAWSRKRTGGQRVSSSSLTFEDSPCRKVMHLKSVEIHNPQVGVKWKLGEEVPVQEFSSSIDHVSKLRGLSPKVLE
ncbi:hypothetical protein TNCV_2826861 [Trichonephila clavipes]|nr:hypothetical protein TNCV_2826861 [Trichonephila clavipes]